MMKALSLRQPWAWAILNAGKDVENRTWKTPFRGDFLIHAAKRINPAEYDLAIGWMLGRHVALAPPSRSGHPLAVGVAMQYPDLPSVPELDAFPRGAIVGRARLVDVVAPSQRSSRTWHMEDQHGFVLTRVQAFDTPIPLVGMLGFFKVPEHVERLARAASGADCTWDAT